jgi:putative transposase
MPWKVCKLLDERLKFVARLLEGDKMAPLCREFGISRKTGYKILTRYNEIGLEGLTDRSRRPTATPISCPSRSRAASCG